MERKIIKTSNAPGAIGPFSQAVRYGDLLFLSGQLPIDMATGELCTGDIGLQAYNSLKNAAAIARAAGTSLSKAIKATVFLTDMADFAQVNRVYKEFFPEDPPARSCIAVAALPKNAKVEMEFICAI